METHTYVIRFRDGTKVRIEAARAVERSTDLRFYATEDGKERDLVAVFLTAELRGYYRESAALEEPAI